MLSGIEAKKHEELVRPSKRAILLRLALALLGPGASLPTGSSASVHLARRAQIVFATLALIDVAPGFRFAYAACSAFPSDRNVLRMLLEECVGMSAIFALFVFAITGEASTVGLEAQ